MIPALVLVYLVAWLCAFIAFGIIGMVYLAAQWPAWITAIVVVHVGVVIALTISFLKEAVSPPRANLRPVPQETNGSMR